jgi:hypothetical protein
MWLADEQLQRTGLALPGDFNPRLASATFSTGRMAALGLQAQAQQSGKCVIFFRTQCIPFSILRMAMQ